MDSNTCSTVLENGNGETLAGHLPETTKENDIVMIKDSANEESRSKENIISNTESNGLNNSQTVKYKPVDQLNVINGSVHSTLCNGDTGVIDDTNPSALDNTGNRERIKQSQIQDEINQQLNTNTDTDCTSPMNIRESNIDSLSVDSSVGESLNTTPQATDGDAISNDINMEECEVTIPDACYGQSSTAPDIGNKTEEPIMEPVTEGTSQVTEVPSSHPVVVQSACVKTTVVSEGSTEPTLKSVLLANEDKPPVAGDKPPVAEYKPLVAEDKPQVLEDKPPVAEEKPPVAADKPPVLEDKPPVAEDKPPVFEDKPPVAEVKPPVAEDKPPVLEDKPPVAEVSSTHPFVAKTTTHQAETLKAMLFNTKDKPPVKSASVTEISAVTSEDISCVMVKKPSDQPGSTGQNVANNALFQSIRQTSQAPESKMSFIGTFLYNIGLDLVKEQAYKELSRIQHKRKLANKSTEVEDDTLKVLDEAAVFQERQNKAFSIPLKSCPVEECDFQTESQHVLDWHRDFPHSNSRGQMVCAYCQEDFGLYRDYQFHLEAMHNKKARWHLRPTPEHMKCNTCSFEHVASLPKVQNHKRKCNALFNMKRCLEPTSHDITLCVPPKRLEAPRQFAGPIKEAFTPKPALNMSGIIPMNNISRTFKPVLNQKILLNNSMYTVVGIPGGYGLQPVSAIKPVQDSTSMLPMQGHVMLSAMQALQPIQPMPQIVQLMSQHTAPRPTMIVQNVHHSPTKDVRPIQQSTNPAPPNVPSTSITEGLMVCELCDGFIKDTASYKVHMYWAHKYIVDVSYFTGLPPLQCRLCSNRCLTNEGLSRHQMTAHSGDLSLCETKCILCKKSTLDLSKHYANEHCQILKTSTLAGKCIVCGWLSKGTASFRKHLAMIHVLSLESLKFELSKQKGISMGVTCTICKKMFNSNEAFRRHCAEHHVYKCTRCKLQFGSYMFLKKHFWDTHRNIQDRCQLCKHKINIGHHYINHLRRKHLRGFTISLPKLTESEILKWSKGRGVYNMLLGETVEVVELSD